MAKVVYKREDKEIYGSDLHGVVKGVNLENRTMSIIGSDETPDRDKDIIMVAGWMLENYLKNPVILWAHDYGSLPIAAATKVVKRRNPARLDFDLRYPPLDLYKFADIVLQYFNLKLLNTSSVGFLPFEWADLEKDKGEWYGGRRFTKQELLELSPVPVPSNPNALQNGLKSFDLSSGQKEVYTMALLGKDLGEIPIIGEKDRERVEAEFHEILSKGASYEEETSAMVQVHPDTPVEDKDRIKRLEEQMAKLQKQTQDLDDEATETEKQHQKELKDLQDDLKVSEEVIAEQAELLKQNDTIEGNFSILATVKAGAVLNKKNKSNLKNAQDLIQKVLDSAEPVEEDEPTQTEADQVTGQVLYAPDGQRQLSAAEMIVSGDYERQVKAKKDVAALIEMVKSLTDLTQSLQNI